jgi:hypothetical protein
MPRAVADDDTIAVCTALDAGYLPLVLVVATSIAASAALQKHRRAGDRHRTR